MKRKSLSRRTFVQSTAAAVTAATVASSLPARAADAKAAFTVPFTNMPDRLWTGPDTWANPLQDWRIASGRLECVNAALDRSLHLLTYGLAATGEIQMSIRLGRIDGKLPGKGSAGFRIGIQGQLPDYRNGLIQRKGLDAGITADGGLFIGDVHAATAGAVKIADLDAVELRLSSTGKGDMSTLTLTAHHGDTELGKVTKDSIPAARLAGGIALVNNFGEIGGQGGGGGARRQQQQQANKPGPGTGKFWFADWTLAGSRIEAHPERAFGPILFNHYTLGAGILKMTAQMPPIGEKDPQTVRLQTKDGQNWKTIAEEKIHPDARTAVFRIEGWNDKADVPYRLAYGAAGSEHFYEGTVRRDPVDQEQLTVADVSCNTHQAFPNAPFVANMAKLNPDVLAFVGDQFYESSGGYGTVRKPTDVAILDYLRKWYLHGWTWRELTKDRPSLCLPDDHDVYQGNIWGEGGAPEKGTQEMGGYEMPAQWVNVVHRTMTSHHADAYDPTPILQDITAYYGPWTYGRISFAVLADRMFKSGPEGKVPPTKDRGDHVKDPNWDPKSADVPGLQLLGQRQMKFLRAWATDWRNADMKAVISQTIFSGVATTHGGQREVLRADYDSNGWPQTPRNEALRVIKQANAVHIAGDQHLPAVIHYGIDQHRDGPVAFAGPAVNCGYPRWFEPKQPGQNRAPGAPEFTGDFPDQFNNPMTVLALANGAVEPRKTVMEQLHDKASGLGLVRFNKKQRTVTFECWPFLADVTQPKAQFPGWPVKIEIPKGNA